MTKRIATKYKIDRRLGCNLWGRPKSPFNKRNSRPGQHGAVGQRRKLSDYGTQLFAKQKLRKSQVPKVFGRGFWSPKWPKWSPNEVQNGTFASQNREKTLLGAKNVIFTE